MRTEMELPGTQPAPGPIGRLVRFGAGALILYMYVPEALFHREGLIRTGWHVEMLGWLFAIVLGLYLLPIVIDRGFGVSWGRRARLVFAGLAIVGLGYDRIVYGTFWAPPVAWLTFATITFVIVHLGISFVVAGLLATPG